MVTADAVKERPILFSGPMIRAIRDGSKTQTRRIMKPQPVVGRYGATHPTKPSGIIGKTPGQLGSGDYHVWYPDRGDQRGQGIPLTESCMYRLEPACPYGQPGDLLWPRESWRPKSWSAEGGWGEIEYRADGQIRQVEGPWTFARAFPDGRSADAWRPSIHMPRWASRITLEITDVRVERLNEISEADCSAEGWEQFDGAFPNEDEYRMASHLGESIDSLRPSFALIWESINGPGSWEANPWVWAISFRKVAG